MSIPVTLFKWGLGLASLAALTGTGAVVKGKLSPPAPYDPDAPPAKDGALRPGSEGRSTEQIVTHACESLFEKACDGTDVADWVWTYYYKAIEPMAQMAQQLLTVLPEGDEDGVYLIAQSNAIVHRFEQDYPVRPPKEYDKHSVVIDSAKGHEVDEIKKINGEIDASIALRKKMLAAFHRIMPGVVPEGISAADLEAMNKPEDNTVAYAAAGTVFGLGLALAFVVASNKKNQKPGG